ncbi:MAG: tetratricopeptide repeat protein [Planctomycetaceae bacterium]|nr:tetratricopeptide repeat protein [Planctomycetaceae bacterium]
MFIFFVSVCVADSTQIRNGSDAFRNGEFDQAAKAFEKAAENLPKDLRLTYNHGIALAASGDLDGAIEILRKSALASDTKIAVLSLNSLAQIHINQAKQQLPKNQTETPPEKRITIIELVNKSEQYYMDILAIEPDNQTVKQNIEMLRAWKTNIESQWEQMDRNKKRQTNLYDRLDWIDEWQHDIANSISQSTKLPNSPKKFQELYEMSEKQQQLIGEIDAMRNDLEKQLKTENTQTDDTILRVFDKIRETATEAKQSLDKFDENDAQKKAELSNKQLSRLKFSLAPFEKIVEQAEKIQTQLVNSNQSSNELTNDLSTNETNKQNNRNVNSTEPDLQQQANNQQLVAELMPLMLYRAKEGLEAKKSQNTNQQPANNSPQPNQTSPESTTQENPNQPEIDPQQESMQLAIKYEPEIRQLAENATTLLNQNNHAEALPKQKQAQKLLREILKQQNQNNQDNKNQNSDQNQNDQNNKNDDNKDKNNEKEQKNDSQNNSKSQSPESKQNEITDAEKLRQEEKAERLMRQVKRKQQEANERREELRNYFLQPTPVDKDW